MSFESEKYLNTIDVLEEEQNYEIAQPAEQEVVRSLEESFPDGFNDQKINEVVHLQTAEQIEEIEKFYGVNIETLIAEQNKFNQ